MILIFNHLPQFVLLSFNYLQVKSTEKKKKKGKSWLPQLYTFQYNSQNDFPTQQKGERKREREAYKFRPHPFVERENKIKLDKYREILHHVSSQQQKIT